MLFSCVAASAENYPDIVGEKMQEAAFRLNSLGIIKGYEDGTYAPDKNITRAEFVAIVMRMIGWEDLLIYSDNFTDVPQSHWAAGNIGAAFEMGLINGVGDNKFAPDANITYYEIYKILMSALGYGLVAEAAGGYPTGYYNIAIKERLTDDLENVNNSDMATRGNVAFLVNNALDISVMEHIASVKDKYIFNDFDTFYENLKRRDELVKVSGIVQANNLTSIDGSGALRDNRVKIGNKVCRTDNTNIMDYIGYYVNAYIYSERSEYAGKIVSYFVDRVKNSDITISAKDIVPGGTSLTTLGYRTEDREKENLLIEANAPFIYNGTVIDNPTVDDLIIQNGSVKLIDNNNSGGYDVIVVHETESAIVKKTSSLTKAIYFETPFTYKGRMGYTLRNDDNEFVYSIEDAEGNPIEFAEIKQGDVLTLETSRDDKYCRVIISDKTVSGKIDIIHSNNEKVEINGEVYYIYKNASGTAPYVPQLGEEATFLLDTNNEILGTSGEGSIGYEYGYVMKTGSAGGISSSVEVKVVKPGAPVKKSNIVNDKEEISYIFKNSSVDVLALEDSVKYYDKFDTPKRIDSGTLLGKIENKLIRYKINSEGNISEIAYYDAVASSKSTYGFNAKILSFGSMGSDPFRIDESTSVLMVPLEYWDSKEDDFLMEVRLADQTSGIEALAYNVDPETSIAEAIIITTRMDADVLEQVPDTAAVSIVGDIFNSVDDKGEWGYTVHMLKEGKEVFATVPEYHKRADLVKNLRKGDLVRYSEYADGGIKNIEKIASASGLGDNYFGGDITMAENQMYGIATDIQVGILDSYYNDYVDVLTIDFEIGEATIKGSTNDGPECYLYDRDSGNIYPATTADILSRDIAGDSADKVLVCTEYNEPIVIVIIRD